MVHTSSLQVALAGLGLNEQQLRRIVVKLVAQLQQHTARQQPVTLQVYFTSDSSSGIVCKLPTASLLCQSLCTSTYVPVQLSNMHLHV